MGDALRLGFGLALTVAVVATGIFLARVLLDKDPRTFDREESSSTGTALGYVRIGLVAVGWFAVVALGVDSVLSLYLGRWGEAAWTVAGAAALGTVPVLMALARLPETRHRLAVWTEAGVWNRKQVQSFGSPSAEELDRLLAESRDPTKSALEREVAATKHGFASDLRARDERTQAAVQQRLEREERARADKDAQERQAAAKSAAEAAARVAEQEQAKQLERMLEARIESLPVVDSRDARLHEQASALALTPRLIQELWGEFKKHVAEPVPTTPEAAVEAARAFESRVDNLDGVLIASGCEPAAVYSGTPRDGYCDLLMRQSEGASSLYRGLLYADTVPALTAALFFAAALPRHWSWGHGHYDRDAELIIGLDRLKSLLTRELRGDALGGPEKWPPPGVRLRRLDDGYEVSCLAVRPGRGLLDISLRIRDGQADALQTRELFTWGSGVLY